MHLIVDKARDEVRVVAAKSPRLPAGRTFAFSSALGGFLVRMAYDRGGTVEYWRKPLVHPTMEALMQARAAYDAANVQLQLGT